MTNDLIYDKLSINNCLNAQGYEQIWHKTISTTISDAVLFFSNDNKPISFNKKMNDLLEQKDQKIENEKSNSKLTQQYVTDDDS